MTRNQLIESIRLKQSFLCVGLDTDLDKIPKHLLQRPDPIFEFNKCIIDATKDYCVAYKPNIAFYESIGPKGWTSLEKTLDYIPSSHFTIADAKRGDIGNTSKKYAQTFFETFDFDAVTIAPYMGSDSVIPFLEFEDKWVILLALTSNAGSKDFQFFSNDEGLRLFEQVLNTASRWGSSENLMFVVGATQAESLKQVRSVVPNHFLLIPGVGSQGGDLKEVYENGHNEDVGLLVNSSRSIIYSGGNDLDFQVSVERAAKALADEMQDLMTAHR